MADRIDVKTLDGSYPIIIARGLLSHINPAALGLNGQVAIVSNTTVAPIYGEPLASALPNPSLITIPDGEHYKTLETVARLYGDFVTAGLDRSAVVVALGGGVVGDTVGFAAATYMRGVSFVQMPTSLLAMVDSSVGGKVGVDLPQGKNLVGAFKQPQQVIIDPDVLDSLPEREWRCGMAEIIKHGLLADELLLELAQDYRANIDEIIPRAIQVKVAVVEADPYERSIRAHLNLGHTFAHAIEQVSGYTWLHGEAVGVGLIAATLLSAQLRLCSPNLIELVEGLVEEVGLPTRIDDLDPEAIWAAMATDKKWSGGRSRFVLLEGIGQPKIVNDVRKGDVIAVLEHIKDKDATQRRKDIRRLR